MTSLPKEYHAKFDWLKAAIESHKSDDCLMWPFAVDRDGYGRVCSYIDGKEDRVFAHRVSFRLVHGRWPDPLGLHKCDVPGCFNPRHIFEGTHAENHADQVRKGRSLRGVMQRDAKLSDELVSKMRNEYSDGASFSQLASIYGVSKIAARWAVNGKTWKHVPRFVKSRPMGNRLLEVCKRGHPMIEDNLYIYRNGAMRQCKICTTMRGKKRK